MAYLHVLLVLLALLSLLCLSVDSGRSIQSWNDVLCETPDKGLGICKKIFECQPMIDFLESKSKFTQKEKNALSSYRCGKYIKEQKVCCPNKAITLEWAYENSTGSCIGLADCKIIYDFIIQNNNFSNQIKIALRKYVCGKDTNDGIKVLCPKELSRELEAARAPVDDSQHANYRLLPKTCGMSGNTDKITNGDQSSLYEFPWAAALKYDQERDPYSCGGTLINDRYVLTAAHCVNTSRLIGVRLGEYDFKTDPDCNPHGIFLDCAESPQDFEIGLNDAIIHPHYDPNKTHNDIALIRLRRPANTSVWSVSPICLPITVAEKTQVYPEYTVIGWGVTEANVTSPILRKVTIPNVEISKCSLKYKPYKKELIHNQMCAGGKNKQDSCVGDSGGPLSAEYSNHGQIKIIQYGIVSFGPTPCGRKNMPGVYTRVDKHTKWILDNLKP